MAVRNQQSTAAQPQTDNDTDPVAPSRIIAHVDGPAERMDYLHLSDGVKVPTETIGDVSGRTLRETFGWRINRVTSTFTFLVPIDGTH